MAGSKSLKDWRETIESEVDFVDVKPYSHNIISLALQAISKMWGKEEANKAIDEFQLEDLGWKKVL
jgi:hypothetical protein